MIDRRAGHLGARRGGVHHRVGLVALAGRRGRPRLGGVLRASSPDRECRARAIRDGAGCVLLGMVIGLLRNSDAAGLAVWQVLLFALLFGTLCFVAWMAPVGLIASFLRGGRTTARPHDPV